MRHHYIWNYLYFIQYLLAKDQTEFSGVESYVHGMLLAKSQDWIPARTSFATQNHGIAESEMQDAAEEREKRLNDKMDENFEYIEKKINGISAEVDRRVGERLAVEMEAFQRHMEKFVLQVSNGAKLGSPI
jgi:hypothetical protein